MGTERFATEWLFGILIRKQYNKRNEGNINFSFEKNGSYVRVILRGYEDIVMEILNVYYNY